MRRYISDFLLFIFFILFLTKTGYAQEPYDAACIGQYVGEYIRDVMGGVGNTTHIKYLSPAFNMTESQYAELLSEVSSNAGDAWNALHGMAGNAYNVFWHTPIQPYSTTNRARVTDWIDYARTLDETQGKPFLITEMGWHDYVNPGDGWVPTKEQAKASLTDEMNQVKSDGGIIAGLLFNAMGTGGSEWEKYIIQDTELSQMCGGDCGKIGVNSAAGLIGSEVSNRAANLKMHFTLGIVDASDTEALNVIRQLLDKDIHPVIRIGVGNNAGGFEEASTYASYIRAIDQAAAGSSNADKTVYVIVGPNEPDVEYWVIPEELREDCGRGGSGASTSGEITIRGILKTTRSVSKVSGKALVTGQTVKNAKVIAYAETTGLTLKNPINISTTLEDGYFEITVPRNSGTRGQIYLTFLCGQSDDVKDLYKMPTTKEYDGLFVSADCALDEPTIDPPVELEYIKKNQFYACSSPTPESMYERVYKPLINYGKSFLAEFNGMNFRDDSLVGSNPNTVPHESAPQEQRLTSAQLYGRYTNTSIALDYKSAIAGTICAFSRCEENDPEIPFWPYSQIEPGNVSCEVYKTANFPIATVDGTVHRGVAPNISLAAPYSDLEQRYDAIYADLQDEPICTHNGEKKTFKKFKVPDDWKVKPNEDFCNSSPDACLGPEYMPYSRLFGGDRQTGQSVGLSQSPTDSVNTPDRDIPLENRNNPTHILSGPRDAPRFAMDRPIGLFNSGNNRNASVSGSIDSVTWLNPIVGSRNLPVAQHFVASPDFEEQDLTPGGKRLPKLYSLSSRGRYERIGPARNMCVCNNVDEEEGGCELPYNEVPALDLVTQLYHQFTAGATWVTSRNGVVQSANPNDPQSPFSRFGYFLNEQFNFFGLLLNIVSNWSTPWDPNTGPQPGQKCAGYWSDNPSAEEAEQCVYNPTSTGCQCSQFGGSGQCTQWRVWRLEYGCDASVSNVRYDVDSNMQLPPLNEIGKGVLNYALSFAGPLDDNTKFTALCTADATALAASSMKAGIVPTDSATKYNEEINCGDDYIRIMDDMQRSFGDPANVSHVFKGARPNNKPVARVPVLPAVEDAACTLGTDSSRRGSGSPILPDPGLDTIPEYMRQVLEAAGDAYHVPAAMLLSVLFSEGSTNAGEYPWSEENVQEWSKEGPGMEGLGMPACNQQTGEGPFAFIPSTWFGPNGPDWNVDGGCRKNDPDAYCNSVNIDFPTRNSNYCNFLDSAYASARALQRGSAGTLAGSQYCIHPASGDSDPNCNTCFGIDLFTSGGTLPTNCGRGPGGWSLRHIVTSRRQYAGFCNDNEFSGRIGGTFQNPRFGQNNNGVSNERQTFTQCFGGTQGICNALGFYGDSIYPYQERYMNSYIFNAFSVYEHFKNPENPWTGD